MACFQFQPCDLEELQSSTYGNDLIKKFNQYREEEKFIDFAITVDDQTFKVHRMILAGFSDYYDALFSHDTLVTSSDFSAVQSVCVEGLMPLLDYAYSGRLKLNMTTIHDILPTAAYLQVTSALDLISTFIKSKMTFSNANQLVTFGEGYGRTDLAKHKRKMILDRFLDFSETEEFLKLDHKTLVSYLEDDSLRTTTESQLLKRVLRWYKHDPRHRESVMHIVLDRIRYTIDGWPAIEYARSHEPFKSVVKCSEILDRCDQYMQDASRKHLNQSYRTRVRYESKTLIQMGGIKSFASDSILGFVLPEEEDIDQEPHGTGRNNYYHTELGQWLPLGINGNTDCRSHNPIVVVNDFGIMVGGYLYASDMDRTYQHCSNEVKLFTPGDFAMWDLPYLLESRSHHAVCHAPGFVYAIGGKNESGPLKTMEQYDLDAEVWKYVKSLEVALFDHAASSYKEKVYVSGGIVNGVIVNTFWCYNPKEAEWTIKPALQAPRAGHTMTLVGNQFIVCGGHTAHDTTRCLASVEAYDLEVKQWSYLTPMRVDCSNMSAAVLNDKLLVVGGQNSVGDLLDDIQEYDPKTCKWGRYYSLPEPMKNMGCCVLTIKLNPNGEEEYDNDSVLEEYNRRFQESEDDMIPPYLDSDDGDPELFQLHLQARRGHHWQL